MTTEKQTPERQVRGSFTGPVDPTDAMIEAALAVDWECDGDERAAAVNVWHAMVAALAPATPERHVVGQEEVNKVARAILVASGVTTSTSDEFWPDTLRFHYEMVAKHPHYEAGRSVFTDAFRMAKAAIAAMATTERHVVTEAEVYAALNGWQEAIINASEEGVDERRRRCMRAALEAAFASEGPAE